MCVIIYIFSGSVRSSSCSLTAVFLFISSFSDLQELIPIMFNSDPLYFSELVFSRATFISPTLPQLLLSPLTLPELLLSSLTLQQTLFISPYTSRATFIFSSLPQLLLSPLTLPELLLSSLTLPELLLSPYTSIDTFIFPYTPRATF